MFLFITFILCIQSCNDDVIDYSKLKSDIKKQFINPEISYPIDNSFSEESWLLGKKLFYDKRFSIDSTINCASCHKLNFAFSDNVSLSLGVSNRVGKRNASTLTNIAHSPYFMREGGVPTLEQQVLVPIQEHVEFANNILEVERRIKGDSTFNKLSQKAYGRNIDYFVITRAISNFERSFISENSRFDRYLKDDLELNPEELRGMEIFFGERGNCSNCHNGFNFTDYSFKNNGLYEIYLDEGRYLLTSKDEDKALFKIPTLRNINLTTPYMHDGSMKTLDDVINHYSEGIKNHKNKSSIITNRRFTEEEKVALKSFLLTLTDEEFINDEKYKE